VTQSPAHPSTLPPDPYLASGAAQSQAQGAAMSWAQENPDQAMRAARAGSRAV